MLEKKRSTMIKCLQSKKFIKENSTTYIKPKTISQKAQATYYNPKNV